MYLGMERAGAGDLVATLTTTARRAVDLEDESGRLRAAAYLAPGGPHLAAVGERLAAGAATVADRRRTLVDWRLPLGGSRSACVGPWPGSATALTCDPAGDGQAVLALGDLATADHVAVLVPGVGTTLATLDAEAERAAHLLAAAGPGTAVIVWLGYDAPGWTGAPSTAAAQAAAGDLASFLHTLPTAAGARLTVIGHSYGSLVATAALEHGAHADALVLLGSPGVGVDRAGEIETADEVYVLRAAGDVIGELGAFGGVDPASGRFGAIRLDTAGAHGHSAYLDEDTGSLANVAAVVTGDLGHLDVHEPTPADQVADGIGAVVDWFDDALAHQRERDLPGWFDRALGAIQRVGDGIGGLVGHGIANGLDDLAGAVGASRLG